MSHRSSRARHRQPRSARPLAEHLGRPAVVCSLAVVALGVSSVLAQPGPAPSVAAAGQSPMSIGTSSKSMLETGSANEKAMSMAALLQEKPASKLTVVPAGTHTEERRSGHSALDPSRAPSKLYSGELPVNTIVAPAQPVVVGKGGEFGWRIAPDLGIREFHNGSDISAPAGTPVVAAAEGEVTAVFWDVWGGNRVEVAHADGLKTTYSHLKDVMVREGDHLAPAQQLGTVGATGLRVTGPHLHFETWVDGAVTDPQSFDWITDAGTLPASASPYTLAHQAPSAEEAAAILDRARRDAKAAEVRPMTTKAEPKPQPKPEPKRTSEPKPERTSEPVRTAPKAAPAPEPSKSVDEAPETEPVAKIADAEPAAETTPAPDVAPVTEAPATAPTVTPAPTVAPAPVPSGPPAAPAVPTAPAEAPATDAVQAAQRAYASRTVDTDADGVVDSLDPDLDGDGIANELDADLDGDGIANAEETTPGHVWTPVVPRSGR